MRAEVDECGNSPDERKAYARSQRPVDPFPGEFEELRPTAVLPTREEFDAETEMLRKAELEYWPRRAKERVAERIERNARHRDH